MKISIIAVGRARGAAADLTAEYESRIRRYFTFESIEVAQETARGVSDATRVRDAEAVRLLDRAAGRGELIALHRQGREWSSRQLARHLQERALHGNAGVAFVIGGAFGLGDELLRRASIQLSLSALTLPHDLARVVLTEQLYRAGTITRGEPYHKGRDE